MKSRCAWDPKLCFELCRFPTDEKVNVCLVLRLRISPSLASLRVWELQTELISDVYWPRTTQGPGSALQPARATVKSHPSPTFLQLPHLEEIESVTSVGQRLIVFLLIS